jgi:hypothetical protein
MGNALEVIEFQATLPVLIERASRTLLDARSSAEVLEARDMARAAYDAAKSAGRFAKAQKAHDDVLFAVSRAKADALEIEARAIRRLADEYDAAQERGEMAKAGKPVIVPDGNNKATTAEAGIVRKEIHEGRKLRDAEKASPGKTERVLKEMVARGEEPTRAKLKREMVEALKTEKPPAKAVDPERRKLAKLTPDALIDEVLGLRADLADAKAEAAKLKTERDDLKAQVKELAAADSAGVIRKLQVEVKNANSAKWREGEKTAAAMKKIHALEKKLKAIGATEIPL